jgi:predicted phosphodiesterase
MNSALATPKRVAFVGDWHENGPWAAKAIAYAESLDADVLIHLGDFGYSYSRQFLTYVTAAGRRQIPILFVDGNHEDFIRLYKYPLGEDGLRKVAGNVWHLPRGFRWQWDSIRFLALGGAHSVDRPYRRPGVSWWAQDHHRRGGGTRHRGRTR